jgi:hypothetical protein
MVKVRWLFMPNSPERQDIAQSPGPEIGKIRPQIFTELFHRLLKAFEPHYCADLEELARRRATLLAGGTNSGRRSELR